MFDRSNNGQIFRRYGIVSVLFRFFGRIQKSAPRSRQAGIRVVCIPNGACRLFLMLHALFADHHLFPRLSQSTMSQWIILLLAKGGRGGMDVSQVAASYHVTIPHT